MPSKPPFAEPDLQQESKDSDQQTCRVSAVRRKIQAEREIDKSPDNRLRDVVCQTHSAVKAQAAHFSAESFILIKQHKRRYQNQRKSKFLPHIKCRPHTLPDNRAAFHHQFFQRIQRRKGNRRHNQYLYPQMQILSGSGKQLFPADIETEQKQSGRLEETPRIDRPKQTGLLPQRYIAPDEVANVSGFRIFSHLRIHLADFQIRQLMRRIYQTGNVVIPFYRLQKKNDRSYQHRLVTPVAGKEQHDTDNDEQQEDIAGRKEGGIQRRESCQQNQTPQEAIAEILPLPFLVAGLYVKRKAEKQGKNSICLPGKKTENAIKNALVQNLQPLRRVCRIYRKDEMFQIMNQDDSHHSKSTQSVHNLYAGTLFKQLFHLPIE